MRKPFDVKFTRTVKTIDETEMLEVRAHYPDGSSIYKHFYKDQATPDDIYRWESLVVNNFL